MSRRDQLPPPEELLGLECLHCVLNQAINTTEVAGVPEDMRRDLTQRALQMMTDMGVNTNNCLQIQAVYRMICAAIGQEDPYRDLRLFYDREMLRLLPRLRQRVQASDDPLRSAVRAAIAGNLIDLASLGGEVTLDRAMEQLDAVERMGLKMDDCASLDAALRQAKTLLVLGDNCGEVALDRLLIETIRDLYPHLQVKYGVRGSAIVNDATREDAAAVGMEEVAQVIDNGDDLLATELCRCSDSFLNDFYGADVIIAKGMGNFETLHACDRNKIWFMLIVKCNVVARMSGAPKGSIICLEKK